MEGMLYCGDVDENINITDAETMFRDLFGKEELEEVRKRGFAQSKPYLQYLKEETERKLREQDGD